MLCLRGNVISSWIWKNSMDTVLILKNKTLWQWGKTHRAYSGPISMTNQKMKNHKKNAMIEAAARLIKSDIKSDVPSNTDLYPSVQSMKLDSALSYVPDTLLLLLNSLFVGNNQPLQDKDYVGDL